MKKLLLLTILILAITGQAWSMGPTPTVTPTQVIQSNFVYYIYYNAKKTPYYSTDAIHFTKATLTPYPSSVIQITPTPIILDKSMINKKTTVIK